MLGEWLDPGLDLADIPMSLLINNEPVHQGSSKAILGDPWKSLQAATRLAEKYNEPIKKGFVILAGAATAAEFLKVGDSVTADVGQLGSVSFRVQ